MRDNLSPDACNDTYAISVGREPVSRRSSSNLFSADHTYDGFNRLIKTDATVGINTTNYEHTYAGKRHLGNIDVTNQQQPVNGKVWRWEGGAGTPSADPIEAPQRSSASGTQYYMLSDERTIEKRSYQVGGVVAGDTNDDSRYAEWQHVNGGAVPTRAGVGVPSELFNAYAITLDADRASSAATNHALQLGATDLEYEVTRVKSPVIGRDMNPMGRGDGTYYANGGNMSGGSIAVTGAKPRFIGSIALGYGNSLNNQEGVSPPVRPHYCFQPSVKSGRCVIDAPPDDPESCCNAENPEVWVAIWGGWKEFRDAGCGEEIPAKGTPCYVMGLQWMKDCLLCGEIHEGDGGGDEEDYCDQYPSASEVQPPGTPPGGEEGGYQGAEPVGGAVTFWIFPTGFTWKEYAGVLWPHHIMYFPIPPILPPPWPPPSPEPGPWNSRFPGCNQEQIDALTRGLHSALMGVETKECCEMLPKRWAKKIMDCMREKILTQKITCLRPGDKYYERCLKGYTAFVVSERVYVCPGTLKESQLGGSLACQLAGTLAEELAHVCGLADPGMWQETVGWMFGLPTAGDYGACIESACYTIAGVKGGVL